MRVRMLRQRSLQDAGHERLLLIALEYDLPPVIAQSLIATGAAVAVDRAPMVAACASPERVLSAPERKRSRPT